MGEFIFRLSNEFLFQILRQSLMLSCFNVNYMSIPDGTVGLAEEIFLQHCISS